VPACIHVATIPASLQTRPIAPSGVGATADNSLSLITPHETPTVSDRFAIDLYHLPDVTDDVQPGGAAAATTYRGFLFADMRGFTAFAERHGNAAAAEMVASFLDIARAAIARHDGAELKTEGDNIHAVFPSASGAVLCGLEIVEGAAELNARQPDRQLGLGIGIHAGEAIETAQGYIGRAVNIAARLCAIARPGEVLVSSTVKGITQASITVGFIPRGRRQLKGIADPILVYAVTRDPSATAPRELHWAVLGTGGGVLAVVAAALIVALAGSLVATGRRRRGPAPRPRPPRSPWPWAHSGSVHMCRNSSSRRSASVSRTSAGRQAGIARRRSHSFGRTRPGAACTSRVCST
jgi:class 3 adenylate cyclase